MQTERRYNRWVGNPNGDAENRNRCVERVVHGYRVSQCRRKRGYGKDGLYCKQHAKRYPPEEQVTV